ncbi:MAG: LamG domain-containing protein [Planctomycetota bacterium]
MLRWAIIRIVTCVTILTFLAPCRSAMSNEQVQDLIGHWKMDETTGTTAYDSAKGNHGPLINGPVWTSGQVNGALGFDGVDDYVDVGDMDSLDFGADDNFSISAWIKCKKDKSTVVAKRDHDGSRWQEGYELRIHQSRLYFVIEDMTGAATQVFGATTVTDDKWHHVVAVRDTVLDKVFIYVDGSRDAAPVTDTTSAALSTDESFRIGRTYTAQYFDGIIDDVRIYGRALSAEEIRALYRQAGLLVTHWKFDERKGNIAHDSVGGSHGTVHGGLWTSGIIDGALDLDGDGDYVDFGDMDELEFGDRDFSISFWFCAEGPHEGGAGNGKILSKYSWSKGRQWAFSQKQFDEGRVYWYTSPDGTTREDVISQNGVSENEWTHVAAVRNGGVKLLYINGVLDNTGPTEGVVTGKPTRVFIGAIEDPSHKYNFFNGKIDDVRVYGCVLSLEEIEQLCGKKPSGRRLPMGPMIAVNNIERAIRVQVDQWRSINETLQKQRQAHARLAQIIQTGGYADLSDDSIVNASQQINTAMQQAQQSKEALERSIKNLERALAALGFELVPKASDWIEHAKRAAP